MSMGKVVPAVPVYDASGGELDCELSNGPSAFKPVNRDVNRPSPTADSGRAPAALPQKTPLLPSAAPSKSTPNGEIGSKIMPADCNGSAVNSHNLDAQSVQEEILRLQQKVEELTSTQEQYRQQNVELQTKLVNMEAEKTPHALLRKITGKVFKRHEVLHNAPVKGRNTHDMMITTEGRLKMLHHSHDKFPLRLPKRPTFASTKNHLNEPLELVTRPNPLRQNLLRTPTCRVVAPLPKDDSDVGTPQVAVEFDCLEALSSEECPTVLVPVTRLGVLQGRLEVQWAIKSASGMPSAVYDAIQPKRGSVIFEDGQDHTFTKMPVANDPTWNVESVYFASLDHTTFKTYPDTSLASRCTLGHNSTIAVYSLNTDSFPAGTSTGASLPVLIAGFVRHNYTEIPRETVKGVLYSMFPAVHYYFSARVLELILNCGVSQVGCNFLEQGVVDAGIADLLTSLGGVGLIWLLASTQFFLFLLQVFFERRKEKLRLDGKATRMLRTNMFTTMIQLSQEAKAKFDPGDIPKSLDTQVSDAIRQVWMNFFELVEKALVCVAQWFLVYHLASDSPDLSMKAKMMMYASSPVMILIVAGVMYFRASKQFRIFSVANQADESWSAFVTMTEFCIPLILSYRQGHVAAKIFDKVHGEFNKANASACDFSKGSIWRIRTWFQIVFFWMVGLGGMAVQRGFLKIGGFVVLMNSVGGLGLTLVEVTDVVNEMVIGCAAVRKIQVILNQDTRRRVRWRLTDTSPSATRRACPSLEDTETSITFERVEYTYPDCQSASVCPTNLQLTCGALICLPEETRCACRKWGSGIATLFKLMSCDLPPARGSTQLFPARWSVICVPALPILFDGTLMYNIAYSESPSQALVSEDDIWNMCRALGMSEHLIGDEDLDVGFNGEHLKFSDRIIVSIARSLLYNTDVLLISSALDVLGENHGLQVLRYLRGYIKRGELSEGPSRVNQMGLLPRKFRHVKTVLYMSKFGVLQQEADQNVLALVPPPDGNPSQARGDDVPELN